MDEEASTTSWVRRAKFSHTVCHRLDVSSLSYAPFAVEPQRMTDAKSRAGPASVINPAESGLDVRIRRHPTTTMQRAVSPHPETEMSDTFKEARSSQKRFSTPNSRRNEQYGKSIVGKLFHKDRDSNETKSPKSPRYRSPLRRFTSMKFNEKSRSQKESTWTKSADMADDQMIDLSKLLIGLRFAHGAHSQLYHGVYMEEPVAVKIIRVPDDDRYGALGIRLEKQFTREVTLLSRLRHQNIVKLVGACKKPLVFCIVTEYLTEGSLRAYLHKLEDKSLPLRKLISMALDIARGLEYTHSQGVIHRDLKPENILISKEFSLKVADFGIACEEAHCDLLADDPGTYRWMAPEMIKQKHHGKKVDVYGFGLILWELVAGSIPYEDMTPIQAAFAVVNKNLRPVIPTSCPPAMKALMEQCWRLQPEKRPEFWQIVKVLEEFESSLVRDGTLNLVPNLTFHDHKKGLRNLIQKLSPTHQTTTPMPKPKFA